MRLLCISWYASSASRRSSYSTKANLGMHVRHRLLPITMMVKLTVCCLRSEEPGYRNEPAGHSYMSNLVSISVPVEMCKGGVYSLATCGRAPKECSAASRRRQRDAERYSGLRRPLDRRDGGTRAEGEDAPSESRARDRERRRRGYREVWRTVGARRRGGRERRGGR